MYISPERTQVTEAIVAELNSIPNQARRTDCGKGWLSLNGVKKKRLPRDWQGYRGLRIQFSQSGLNVFDVAPDKTSSSLVCKSPYSDCSVKELRTFLVLIQTELGTRFRARKGLPDTLTLAKLLARRVPGLSQELLQAQLGEVADMFTDNTRAHNERGYQAYFGGIPQSFLATDEEIAGWTLAEEFVVYYLQQGMLAYYNGQSRSDAPTNPAAGHYWLLGFKNRRESVTKHAAV